MKKFDLSIVIPAYKEERCMESTLNKLSNYIKNSNILSNLNIEVMVVSANSPDRTHKICKENKILFKNFKLLLPGDKVGKGRDVKYGMLRASGEYILFMDADLATPLKYIEKFYTVAKDGADIVVATRNLKKHHNSLLRLAISNLGNLIFRIISGIWIEDSQCGFKLFERKSAKLIFTKQTIMGWGFDMEILTIAKIHNYKINTIRVNDWNHVEGGSFEKGAIRNSINSLKDLMIIFKNKMLGNY